jgi:hypothetical protein
MTPDAPTTGEDNVIIELVTPKQSADALQELAGIVCADAADPLALLLQDALRIHVWVLRQQVHGRRVLSLSEGACTWLESRNDAPDDVAPVLVGYVPEGAEDRLRAWLDLYDPEPRP